MKTSAKIYGVRADDGTIKLGYSVDPARRAKQIGRAVDVAYETDVFEQVERIERLRSQSIGAAGVLMTPDQTMEWIDHSKDLMDQWRREREAHRFWRSVAANLVRQYRAGNADHLERMVVLAEKMMEDRK